jgi:beta-lactamase superfamily II metal-dependent hydrolase
VGKNNYGHPNNEVLARLEQFDITTLRNDKNGDIKIISLGNNLKIKTEK